ncbi:MAG: hypothetical protein RMZ69_06350 [Nostoc sp. ChiQUE01a]|nr:hypothetical protein [Nostoc sp. ChiQUE01a]
MGDDLEYAIAQLSSTALVPITTIANNYHKLNIPSKLCHTRLNTIATLATIFYLEFTPIISKRDR